MTVLDRYIEALDRGLTIDDIYMDFQKAFDIVPHKRLARKLRSFCIAADIIMWIESFITQWPPKHGVLRSISIRQWYENFQYYGVWQQSSRPATRPWKSGGLERQMAVVFPPRQVQTYAYNQKFKWVSGEKVQPRPTPRTWSDTW